LAYSAEGGDGCISVTSNVAPALCRSMFLACKQGQIARAGRLAGSIALLTTALFRETNPVPIKYALSLFDLASPRVRLPLQGGTRQRPGAAVRRIFGVYDQKDRWICPRRPPRCGGVGAEFLTNGFALQSKVRHIVFRIYVAFTRKGLHPSRIRMWLGAHFGR